MERMRWDEAIERLPEAGAAIAEVGVWRGFMSKEFMDSGRCAMIYLVDPWQPGVPGTPWYESTSNVPRYPLRKFKAAYLEVVELVKQYPGEAQILKMPSLEAAGHIEDGSLDLVFLDGDHSREALTDDITAWLPKVKPGGWLGGHDLDHMRFTGIREAVEFHFGDDFEVGADFTWWKRIGAADG